MINSHHPCCLLLNLSNSFVICNCKLGNSMMATSRIIWQCLVVLCISYLLFTAKLSISRPTKIILPLIHRNTIRSPFYNPKLSISNPPAHGINSTGQFSLPEDDIRGNLVPDSITFFVNISIGEPPVPQLLVIDTGSYLTWVCTKCAPSLSPVYDPKRSSTYKKIGCPTTQCSDYYQPSYCRREELQCSYRVEYGDRSSSTTGLLATEKFTFDTSTEGLVELPNIMFGCGVDNRDNAAKISGILALGPWEQYSLVASIGNRFSYCTGNISDHHYASNQLILGDGAIFEGSSTPMKIKSNQYYVNLEGISIGEKQLNIDSKELGYHFIFDSGSSYTSLQRNLLDSLEEELVNLMDGLVQPLTYKINGERLCYYGNLVRDLKGFPVVSFHFAEGADLDLGVEAMFRQLTDDMFCTAINDIYQEDMNIIGAYAQQYYNIGFDSIDNKVTFQMIDCELLEG